MAQQRELKEINLDAYANKIQAAEEARRQAAELIAFAENIEDEVKEAMGDAERATVFGVPVFTYTPKNAYAWGKFRDAFPHVARQYTTTKEVEVLDQERIIAEQADLIGAFQTREFRRVSRKPGT